MACPAEKTALLPFVPVLATGAKRGTVGKNCPYKLLPTKSKPLRAFLVALNLVGSRLWKQAALVTQASCAKEGSYSQLRCQGGVVALAQLRQSGGDLLV